MTTLDDRLATQPSRPYQMLPPLDTDQRFILRQSIEKCGVLEPVVFDEDGDILDGHHRVEIAEELGIEYPRRVISDLTDPEKWMYAVTVNVARRQLDQTTRTGLVAQMRLRGMSIREIAKRTGLSKTTVARDVDQLSHSGQLNQPERITGADGRERPATRPTPTPGPVDTTISPADPGKPPASAADAPAPSQKPAPIPEPADRWFTSAAEEAPRPAAAPSTAPAGSGSPAADGDLRDLILVALPIGEDDAVTLGELASKLPDGCWSYAEVRKVLDALEDAGRAACTQGSAALVWWATGLGEQYKTDPAERIASVAEVAPEFVKPVEPAPVPAPVPAAPALRLVPTEDEKQAAERRDARGLLLRAVEILAPAHDRAGFAKTWARQLGPYDAELSGLIRRATEAMTTLDELIEGCGQ